MIKTVLADRMTNVRTLANAGSTEHMAIVALVDTDYATMTQIVSPLAKSANSVAANLASNAATAFTISASPVTPRNLRVTFAALWDGGNVVVVGTDQFGQAATETFTSAPGTVVVGTKIFATVASATKTAVGATANAASIGTGDKLGLPAKPTLAYGFVGDSTPTAAAVATMDTTYGGFTPANVPNGTLTYTVMFTI